MPKPGQPPVQEAKPSNKPEETKESKEEKGGQKSHRNKEGGGDKSGKANKPHKKKIYNY